MKSHKMPDSKLGRPYKKFSETFRAEEVLMKKFFPKMMKKEK